MEQPVIWKSQEMEEITSKENPVNMTNIKIGNLLIKGVKLKTISLTA